MSQMKLGHHGKPGKTRQSFYLTMGILSSEHLRSHIARFIPSTDRSRIILMNSLVIFKIVVTQLILKRDEAFSDFLY